MHQLPKGLDQIMRMIAMCESELDRDVHGSLLLRTEVGRNSGCGRRTWR